VDITDQILDDHHRQRRMFAQLDELGRDDIEHLTAVWDRLATFLEVHAEAEEELFYPRLLEVGKGAADADDAEEETEDAIRDHNDIRQAIRRARRHDVGTDEWRRAVADARRANSDHMAEEERQALSDFRRQTDIAERHALGASFAAFEGEHFRGVDSSDEDPDEYVREMGRT
jgi:hypothetical protein